MSVAELSKSDVMGARFREGIRAAGGLVVGDSATDQETLRRAGAHLSVVPKQDDRPGYIEIDVGDGERVIAIRERDGTLHELHPMLTYGAAKKIPFFTRQIQTIQTELESCDDEDRYMALLDRAGQTEERIIQLAIPDFPSGLLDRLETDVLQRLRDAAERLRAPQGNADPN